MLRTRQAVMNTATLYILMSCRIAVRYAVCRRQFKSIPGEKKERKLLDYQTHMAIIAPILSYAFVNMLSSSLCADLTTKALRVY